MQFKNKVILTDVDGVLLDWEYAFHQWMLRHGYEFNEGTEHEYNIAKRYKTSNAKRNIRMFNESAQIRKLPPLRDAIKYVKKLHEEHGYVFHVITSLSTDAYSQHLRTKNLREMFGDSVFEKYIYLDTGADKDEVLEQYRDTGAWWVEDKWENALAGENVGLKPMLMAHTHNVGHADHAIVNNWKEIYHKVTESRYEQV